MVRHRPWVKQFFDFVNEPTTNDRLRDAQRQQVLFLLDSLRCSGPQADLDAVFEPVYDIMLNAAEAARRSTAGRSGPGVFTATAEESAWLEIESLGKSASVVLTWLRDSGEWRRLRQCAFCTRWLIAEHARRKFCDESCKEQARAPRSRPAHAKYMRVHRQIPIVKKRVPHAKARTKQSKKVTVTV